MSNQLVHLIYTANLRADFERMPRIFTTIQNMRQGFGTAPHPFLLMDIGGAWSNNVWESRVTEHRAPYLLLDAMGYHVARADGLDLGAIMGLQTVVQTRLIDDTVLFHWQWRDIQIAVGAQAKLKDKPSIGWSMKEQSPSSSDTVFYETNGQKLIIFPLNEHFGYLEIEWPSMMVRSAKQIAFDDHAKPDPTVMATIEYVQSEAQFYDRKQKGD